MNYLDKKPNQDYGFIYMYTAPNGKKYVGQTIRSLSERAKNKYGEGYINCPIFFAAIKKYGFENFTVQILEECPINDLNKRETFYMKKEKSLPPHGYNCRLGNSKKSVYTKGRKRVVNQYDLQGNYIATFSSVKEAAEKNGIAYQTISAILRGSRTHHREYTYTYKGQKPKIITPQKTHGRITAQYSLDGVYITRFPSANHAARAIGKNSNAGRNIRAVCAGERETAYGFKWKYLD